MHRALLDLTALLDNAPPLAGGVFSRQRPAWIRHDRKAMLAWRRLARALSANGVPACEARLGRSDRHVPGFLIVPGEPGRILMPTRRRALDARALDMWALPLATRAWGEALVLLHEWAHARLYHPHHWDWADALPWSVRTHADPVWAQASEYVGWRIFHEFYADLWSAAWINALAPARAATELVDALAATRERVHAQAQARGLLGLHPTATALRAWQASGHPPSEAKILDHAAAAFAQWLENEGERQCALAVERLRLRQQLAGHRPAYWLEPAPPVWVPVPALAARMAALRQAAPDHPLVALEQSARSR